MKIPEDIKAVIFDLDGLLIDSEPAWEKADAELFRRHNKVHTPEINKQIMGMKPREIVKLFIEKYGFEGQIDDLLRERMDLVYGFLLDNLTLMEGAKEILDELQQKKIIMAIATSGHSKEKAAEITAKLGIDHYMKVILSGDDVLNGKPAPDIYLETALKISVVPFHCLVFEDAPNGVKSAKAATMRVYGVNKDIFLAAQLKEAGADQVFKSLTQFLTML